MASRVLTIKPVRGGYVVSVANRVQPLSFPNATFEDVLFELELLGYDISRARRQESHRERQNRARK